MAEDFLEPHVLKQVPISILSLRHAIGVKQQCVSGFELKTGGHERRRFDQTNGKRSSGIQFAHLSSPQQQWRGMAGADELQSAIDVEQPEEHGGATAHRRAVAEKSVR